jgi:hypothetical protein
VFEKEKLSENCDTTDISALWITWVYLAGKINPKALKPA